MRPSATSAGRDAVLKRSSASTWRMPSRSTRSTTAASSRSCGGSRRGASGDRPFAGMAIGDCLGQTKQDWYGVVDLVVPLLPDRRPRHLLGVGEPDDLVE